jgi:hypothetical protein
MAVHLPSDLIADVMRNADPVRRKAATAKLDAAGDVAAGQFALTFDSLRASRAIAEGTFKELAPASLSSAPSSLTQLPSSKEPAYQGFERLVLRSLFETLLPGEDSGSFGEGPSAGIWRSMAADQLAGVYSENGGIGIAKLVSENASSLRREAQWPYFSKDAISTFRG